MRSHSNCYAGVSSLRVRISNATGTIYQVWGRITYNPDADPEIWQREFDRRFDDRAGPLIMRALHRASQILPRIVAASYNYHYFPTTPRLGGNDAAGRSAGIRSGNRTDVEQFQSYQEAARARFLPARARRYVRLSKQQAGSPQVARHVLDDVEAATAAGQQLTGSSQAEFLATTTDLRILAHLAEYHAARMQAAVWYNVYLQSRHDTFAVLEQCSAAVRCHERPGKESLPRPGDVYPETLNFGVHRVGFSKHWKEELEQLVKGYSSSKHSRAKTVWMPRHDNACWSGSNHMAARSRRFASGKLAWAGRGRTC